MTNDTIRNICIEEALLSNCRSTRYGCVILNEKCDVISKGHNISCDPDKCCIRKDQSTGIGYDRCMALHAEQMAILGLINNPKFSNSSRLFMNLIALHRDGSIRDNLLFYPCITCAKLIVNIPQIVNICLFTNKKVRSLGTYELLEEAIRFMTVSADEEYKRKINLK